MPTLSIQIGQGSQCGVIRVLDLTAWTGIAPDKRSDYGLALFVSSGPWGGPLVDDPTLADITSPGDDTLAAEWEIISENLKQYEVKVYMVPVYDESETYNATDNDLTFINGVFYQADAAGITGAFDSSKWVALDNTSKAAFATAVADSNSNVYQMVDSAEMRTVCSPLSLVKTACRAYNLVGDGLDFDGATITVTSIETGLDIIEETISGSTSEYAIALTADGVYKVVLETSDGVLYELPIYEWCGMRSCLEGLIRSVLCQCDDICADTGCDDSQINTYRVEINRIISLYYPLMGMIKADLNQYYGFFVIDETREEFMSQVSDMIARLKIVVDRCGICSDEATTSTTDCNC